MQDDVTTRFRAAYWALIHNADALRLRVWEDYGVTLPQLRILFMLRAHPDATTSTLAKLLGLTAPTVSAQVDKLVRAGLIARGGRAEDRRVIPLALTEAGRGAVGAISQTHQTYLTNLAADLGADLVSVTAAMERLAAAIAQRPANEISESDEERLP
jgi:DNA-binding MarR family transcriptional regulator